MSNDTQQIKVVYGEILGIFTELQNPKEAFTVPARVADQFNECLKELTQTTGQNYERFALTRNDLSDHSSRYETSIVRPRIGSVVRRLEAQYGFDSQNHETPMIINVTNTNKMTVTVTPIQEIIQNEQDDEIKDLLVELREALNRESKPEKTSKILTTIQQKSWEIFIKVLPYVLDQISKRA